MPTQLTPTRALALLAVLSLVPAGVSCGSPFGAAGTVRARHSIQTGCPDDEVTVSELPGPAEDSVSHRYRAIGCGQRATYACRPRTAGSQEWDCRQETEQDPGTVFGTTEGGDSTGTSTMVDGGVVDGGPHAATGHDVDGGAPVADAAAPADAATAVRAAIDAHSVDILGCTGRQSIGVHAVWDATGNVTFNLPGDLAGRPEEGCVRTAIGPLHVGGAPGELMDLVRR